MHLHHVLHFNIFKFLVPLLQSSQFFKEHVFNKISSCNIELKKVLLNYLTPTRFFLVFKLVLR